MIISRNEAKSQGLKFYNTGVVCKKGHTSPRYVCNYHCLECSKMDSQKESTKEYQAQYRSSAEGKYVRHKNHAKERGVDFKLSFLDWLEIWESSGHFLERGNVGGQYVMARYGDTGAYEKGNVRIELFNENIREAVNIRIEEGRHAPWGKIIAVRDCNSNGQPLE